MTERIVAIDCFPASVSRYVETHTIVAIDVIRATTLAITGVATGRRCLIARDLDDALAMRDRLGGAILAGELGGYMPFGFDMNNSPTELLARDDIEHPLVMLSTSGTQLMLEAGQAREGAYAASFRNLAATASHLVDRHERIALIGAGSRGEFRDEDQLGCARIAETLLERGFRVADDVTEAVIDRWRGAPLEAIEGGNSVGYLRRTGQVADVDFTLEHIDDLDMVCVIDGSEVRALDRTV